MTDQGATPMKGWHIDGYDTRVQNWGTDEELTVEEVEKRLDDYAHLLEVERAAKAADLTSEDAEGLARVCIDFQGKMIEKGDEIGRRFWHEQTKKLQAFAALRRLVEPKASGT